MYPPRLVGMGAQKNLLLGIDEVAELLDVPKPTLYRWRLTGKGPRSVVLPNRRVKYRVRDLEEWLDSLEEIKRR
jgi:predicted DNA-binding transcriptional regulator AlpA